MHGESHPHSGACSTLRATLDRTQHGTKYSSDIRNLGLRAEQFSVEFIRHFGWARRRAVRRLCLPARSARPQSRSPAQHHGRLSPVRLLPARTRLTLSRICSVCATYDFYLFSASAFFVRAPPYPQIRRSALRPTATPAVPAATPAVRAPAPWRTPSRSRSTEHCI